MKTRVIFVHGDNFISEVIQIVTDSEWTHVGIEMLGSILEALPDGVAVSQLYKYTDFTTKCVEVDIPNMEAAESKAKEMIGKPYSFMDGLEGGLHDLFGVSFPNDGEAATNCSKLVAIVLRAGEYDLGQECANCITPGDDDKLLSENA